MRMDRLLKKLTALQIEDAAASLELCEYLHMYEQERWMLLQDQVAVLDFVPSYIQKAFERGTSYGEIQFTEKLTEIVSAIKNEIHP